MSKAMINNESPKVRKPKILLKRKLDRLIKIIPKINTIECIFINSNLNKKFIF
jgi:hypothetical protein